jgi:hypothetical protein
MITSAEVAEVLGRWWWNYDEGRFETLPDLLTEDMHFSCRTDTGTTAFEEFVRADVSGRDTVMEWQIAHRSASPYPLRHNGTNIHVVERSGDEATFSSYICVTHVVAGMPSLLSSAIVNGRVRREGDAVRIAALEVVLDTQDSVPLSSRPA